MGLPLYKEEREENNIIYIMEFGLYYSNSKSFFLMLTIIGYFAVITGILNRNLLFESFLLWGAAAPIDPIVGTHYISPLSPKRVINDKSLITLNKMSY